ncbi:MAG: response regulator [Desulfobacterales bacterium]|jgi:DNA-binding NtrC family response regulator
MRVLLVDDEIEFISALAERLNLRGIPAQWAASAQEALVLLKDGCFDIAVLDIKMPETGGIDLMHQIKVKCPNTQFIFLSGHGSEKTYQQVCKDCSEASYLIKPVDIHSLIDEMNKLLKACSENGV